MRIYVFFNTWPTMNFCFASSPPPRKFSPLHPNQDYTQIAPPPCMVSNKKSGSLAGNTRGLGWKLSTLLYSTWPDVDDIYAEALQKIKNKNWRHLKTFLYSQFMRVNLGSFAWLNWSHENFNIVFLFKMKN